MCERSSIEDTLVQQALFLTFGGLFGKMILESSITQFVNATTTIHMLYPVAYMAMWSPMVKEMGQHLMFSVTAAWWPLVT